MSRLLRRNDAERNRAAEPERVADRHHPVADFDIGGGAEFYIGKRLLGRDLQEREVGLRVAPDDLVDDELGAVVEVDVDLFSAFDDVVVGDDQPFLAVDHEA